MLSKRRICNVLGIGFEIKLKLSRSYGMGKVVSEAKQEDRSKLKKLKFHKKKKMCHIILPRHFFQRVRGNEL